MSGRHVVRGHPRKRTRGVRPHTRRGAPPMTYESGCYRCVLRLPHRVDHPAHQKALRFKRLNAREDAEFRRAAGQRKPIRDRKAEQRGRRKPKFVLIEGWI